MPRKIAMEANDRALQVRALASGAQAIGALALGALAIGRLAIGRAKIKSLEIDELVFKELRLTGSLDLPADRATEPDNAEHRSDDRKA